MADLDEILYNALKADETLMTTIGGRITSTCFEVSPDEQDNTQLPCIIVTDDGIQSRSETKDNVWESSEDSVQASVEIDGRTPKEVKQLMLHVRRAINSYVTSMTARYEETPYLQSVRTNGIAWDWMKPCYHSTVSYQCLMNNHIYDDDEQSE